MLACLLVQAHHADTRSLNELVQQTPILRFALSLLEAIQQLADDHGRQHDLGRKSDRRPEPLVTAPHGRVGGSVDENARHRHISGSI